MRITLVYLLPVLPFFPVLKTISAQSMLITEVVSSNHTLVDEDCDTPDWFELSNINQIDLDHQGWTITDKRDQPTKWTFPPMTLSPGEHLQVWASGKDRTFSSYPKTIINRGNTARYLASQTSGLAWTEIQFNDAFWSTGPTGIGYGDGDDATAVPSGTEGLLIRIPFSLADITNVQKLIFDIDFDDAYIAYLNGQEISRTNVVDQGNGLYSAQTDREAQLYTGGSTEKHIIENPTEYLAVGPNILAIRLINISNNSSDLSCIPFLTLDLSQTEDIGVTPPVQGSVVVNNRLTISQSIWLGDYFESIPIRLEATPVDGFVFSHWEGDVQRIQAVIDVDVDHAMTVVPIFDLDTSIKNKTEEEHSLTAYPNPTDGTTILVYESKSVGYGQISIFDPNGSKVTSFSQNFVLGKNDIVLDLSQKPKDTYQVRVEIDNRISTTSIIKI